MKNCKIVITSPDYYPEECRKILRKIGNVVITDKSNLKKEIENATALFIRVDTRINSSILKRAKKLRVIASATTGIDHIDVEYAGKKGIKIIHLHGSHSGPTAELAFASMLTLARRIPWANNSVLKGEWKREKYIGTSTEGKILGIIGLGRIGSRVASYGKMLGMKILVYDPYVKNDVIKQFGSSVGFTELLKSSDFISLHTPLTNETNGMINESALRSMKSSAFIINTSRGAVIKEDALLKALSKKWISGASLDVFIDEPLSTKSKLIAYAKSNENLLLTPHIGASTKEAISDVSTLLAKQVIEILHSTSL